jgi:hypothetical protein
LNKALEELGPAEKDLERLRVEMDTFTWIDMELQDMETRVQALQNDDMLQMRIRGLCRNWQEAVQGHKSYLMVVRTVHA